MCASGNGHTKVVKTLLRHGASVDEQNEVGNSAISITALFNDWR